MFDQSMLPTILRHSEIASYIDGNILVLDRRKYPEKKDYFIVKEPRDAFYAIKNMVTQGGGPLELSLKTMILSKDKGYDLKKSAELLISARPTNRVMANTLKDVLKRESEGEDIREIVSDILNYYDNCYDKMSDIGEMLIEDGDGILTTCFAEHSFLLSLKKAVNNGKKVTVYVPETRPYLQGAHLTLPSLMEMDIPCFLITDGMPAFFMREKKIQKYMTATDAVLPDLSVSNKVGTLENAIAASYFGIPYYPFALRSAENRDIKIEFRDQDEVLKFRGEYITRRDAKALYPAFDIIERSLIKAIITPDGLV